MIMNDSPTEFGTTMTLPPRSSRFERTRLLAAPKLHYVTIDKEVQAVLAAGMATFEQRYDVVCAVEFERIQGIVDATMTALTNQGTPPWCGRLTVATQADGERTVVGTCAFKGPPEDGCVEIAYHTFPEFEGRGYATAMAGDLIQDADQFGLVDQVIAHTLPETNRSTQILERHGFQRVGLDVDPEAGIVWRWGLRLR